MSLARTVLPVLLGLAASGAARADPAPICTLHQVAALSAVTLSNGTLAVPARIDGQPVALMVDTGALRTELSADEAARLGLPVLTLHNPVAFDVFGRPIDQASLGRALDLGNLHLDHMPMLVAPHTPWGASGAVGLLGPDVMSHFDLELDPAAGRVNLYSQDHCPGKVVYWSASSVDLPLEVAATGHIYVTMTLDGQDVRALIDTGAGVSVLNLDVARHRFDLDPDSPGMTAIDPGTPGLRYRYPFKTLAMDGITIGHPALDILPNRARQTLDKGMQGGHFLHQEPNGLPDLLLGMSTLSHLHLYIAYGEHRLYATAADAH